MKNILIISLLALCGLVISSCSKDEPCMDETNKDCPNFNPCSLKEPRPKIDFEVYQTFGVANAPEFKTDTLMPGYGSYFSANIKNAISYEWRIGIDTVISSNETFSISFDRSDSTLLVNNPVPVTLIVEYQPDLVCFPNQNGRDTITKFIHFRQTWQAAYFGKWKVYVDGDTDNPYEIEIRLAQGSLFTYQMQIANLYNEGNNCVQDSQVSGYMAYNQFIEGAFYFVEIGCGTRNYPYATSGVKGNVNTENDILYLTWREGHYNATNTEFLYFPHSLVGYKID
jgi:hypothetical protein